MEEAKPQENGRFTEILAQSLLDLIRDNISGLGKLSIFVLTSLRWGIKRPLRINEMIRHMEFIGNKSVFIIALTGTFTGMVFSFQAYTGFQLVNAGNLVGPTVAIGILRELGPVLTGLIVAARAGGAMAAQLATMRVTEQIDALEVMGVNPKHYLVAPRLMAAVLSLPLLAGIFDVVAMAGAWFLCVHVLSLDEAIFMNKVYQYVNPKDINQGLFKSAVFGMLFSSICTYRGFFASGGARGVGNATNRGVVMSMVMIIIVDYFITNLINFYLKLW